MVDAFRGEGAQVAVLERDEAKCERSPPRSPAIPSSSGDATTRAANEEAVAAAVAAFGGLDVLVNCVGVFDFYRGLGDLDADGIDDAFDEMFAVNVKSQLHSVKAALPALRASRGSVVLTESTSAYYPGRGGVLYVSSKFAVRGLVTALAHELAPEIRVNGVAPGGTARHRPARPAQPRAGRPKPGRPRPNRAAELAARVPAAGGAVRRGPRLELRVPGLRAGPGHHRWRGAPRRRDRDQGMTREEETTWPS